MASTAAKRSPLQPQFCQLLVAERALARGQPGVWLQATVTNVNTPNNEPLTQNKDTVVISTFCLIHNNQKNLSIGTWQLQDKKHQLVTVDLLEKMKVKAIITHWMFCLSCQDKDMEPSTET